MSIKSSQAIPMSFGNARKTVSKAKAKSQGPGCEFFLLYHIDGGRD